MRELPRLSIVIPCYNEQEVLPITAPMFLEQVQTMVSDGLIREGEIIFIDDGSTDNTWQIITELAAKDERYKGARQSRNRGHQNTVLAGLMEAKERSDITISIDCDGQDDISAMSEMVQQYLDGSEVVYGVRSSRETDSFFKRFTAEGFYKTLQMLGVEVVFNHADYRLISKRVLDEFEDFKEVNLFLRGMIPLVGFKSSKVYYERHERLAGESHYPIRKMVGLAWDGITSLSTKPIRIITVLGLTVAVISFALLLWTLGTYFFSDTVHGWASMVSVITFLGGIQLVSLGVIGEYVGKIYLETKRRPRYIISERTY